MWYYDDMTGWLKSLFFGGTNPGQTGVLDVTKTQLREHRDVIESLRDYDKGEKDIHTADLERRLRNV